MLLCYDSIIGFKYKQFSLFKLVEMKRLKISFLAIVAILAFSITASVHARTFNRLLGTYTCGSDEDGIQDLSSLKYAPCGTSTLVTLTAGQTICHRIDIPGLQIVGGVRFTCYSFAIIPVDFPGELDCMGANSVICCIKLINEDECSEQDDCSEIRVYCRPANLP